METMGHIPCHAPDKIKLLVEKIDQLPTLPGILGNVLTVTDDPDATARDLEMAIIHDPPISAKVVAFANSPYYGFQRHVVDLGSAISLIGFNAVKNITIGLSVFSCFHDPYSPLSTRVNAIYLHSFAVGFAADRFAQISHRCDRGPAFLGGLLHDIGKMVLIKLLDLNYNNILEIARDKQTEIRQIEREVLGLDHADAGAWLVETWGLPDIFVRAIQDHHFPGDTTDPLAKLLTLADLTIRRMGIGNGGNPCEPVIEDDLLGDLDLTEEHLAYTIRMVEESKATIVEMSHP
ncbi:MAG: HDOD domain-containing protein [Deltaproteobacteria bacterium]|nr:HDOD domain-containing protein [Deltaproteobacteria bacterium]